MADLGPLPTSGANEGSPNYSTRSPIDAPLSALRRRHRVEPLARLLAIRLAPRAVARTLAEEGALAFMVFVGLLSLALLLHLSERRTKRRRGRREEPVSERACTCACACVRVHVRVRMRARACAAGGRRCACGMRMRGVGWHTSRKLLMS